MRYFLVLTLLLMIAVATAAEAQGPRVRQPIAAGTWYPKDAKQLHSDIMGYLEGAEDFAAGRICTTAVVPSGPYAQCGRVMAEAVKQLTPGAYDRVIILAPAHFAKFRGCSIAAVQAYRTPLGDVILDGPAIRTLCFSSLFGTRALKEDRSRTNFTQPSHETEYAIEVVLPFLQARLGSFRLVPILVGEMKNYEGRLDEPGMKAMATALKAITNDRTLLIVSTGFTHYGPAHGFMPFAENVRSNIEWLDVQAIDMVARLDYEAFWNYLRQTGNPIDGQVPLGLLMKMVSGTTRGVLLDYCTSAGDAPEPKTSVSYGALCFFRPGLVATAAKGEE